jgi:hypothetical protein
MIHLTEIKEHQRSRQHAEALEFYEVKQLSIKLQKLKIQDLKNKIILLKIELEELKAGQPYYE